MNKGTSSPGIPASTTPLLFTDQERADIRQNMLRTLQEEEFLEPNLFFKEANSTTKDIGLNTLQDPDRNSDNSTKTKGALTALYKIL